MNFMETAFNQFTGNYRLVKAKISSGAEANTVFFLSLSLSFTFQFLKAFTEVVGLDMLSKFRMLSY